MRIPIPVRETPEQIQQREEEHREEVRRVVRFNATAMARTIERFKVQSQENIERILEDHRRLESLQTEFHYLLQVLEKEHLV